MQTFCREYPDVLAARVSGLVLLSTSARRVLLDDEQAAAVAQQLAERGDKTNWAPFPLLRMPWSDLVESVSRFVFGRSPNRVDIARSWAMYDAMDDEYLGRIMEIIETGANDVYVVKTPDGYPVKEILLPAIASVIIEVDIPGRRMSVVVPEGLV